MSYTPPPEITDPAMIEYAETIQEVTTIAEDLAAMVDEDEAYTADSSVDRVRDMAHFGLTTPDGREWTVTVSPRR